MSRSRRPLPSYLRRFTVITGRSRGGTTIHRSNRCYIVPSLDLVVARVGSGPPTCDEQGLIGGIVGAIIEDVSE